MGFCNHGILPSGTSFDKFCPHIIFPMPGQTPIHIWKCIPITLPYLCAREKPPCARTKPHPGQEPILILPGQLPGQNIEVTHMPHPLHTHFPTPFAFARAKAGTFLKVFDRNALPYPKCTRRNELEEAHNLSPLQKRGYSL